MATVNFSVPEDIKRDFDATFEGQNKSAILSRLMREAVIDVEQRKRRAEAAKRILELREVGPRVSSAEVDEARRLGRS